MILLLRYNNFLQYTQCLFGIAFSAVQQYLFTKNYDKMHLYRLKVIDCHITNDINSACSSKQ